MVKVTVICALVLFVKALILPPLPLAAMPVAFTVLSLVQLNIVEPTFPVKAMVVIVLAEQRV